MHNSRLLWLITRQAGWVSDLIKWSESSWPIELSGAFIVLYAVFSNQQLKSTKPLVLWLNFFLKFPEIVIHLVLVEVLDILPAVPGLAFEWRVLTLNFVYPKKSSGLCHNLSHWRCVWCPACVNLGHWRDTNTCDYIKLYHFSKLLLVSLSTCRVWCPCLSWCLIAHTLSTLHRYIQNGLATHKSKVVCFVGGTHAFSLPCKLTNQL